MQERELPLSRGVATHEVPFPIDLILLCSCLLPRWNSSPPALPPQWQVIRFDLLCRSGAALISFPVSWVPQPALHPGALHCLCPSAAAPAFSWPQEDEEMRQISGYGVQEGVEVTHSTLCPAGTIIKYEDLLSRWIFCCFVLCEALMI